MHPLTYGRRSIVLNIVTKTPDCILIGLLIDMLRSHHLINYYDYNIRRRSIQ